MRKTIFDKPCLKLIIQGAPPLHAFARKLTLMLLLPFLAVSSAMGQSNARVFTYDAAGNRIAIGVPVLLAPGMNQDLQEGREDEEVKVTQKPDGHVRIDVRTDGERKEYSARVFASSGKLVAKLATTSNPISNINLSDLQPGVYVIDVAIDGRHVTHKVVKE